MTTQQAGPPPPPPPLREKAGLALSLGVGPPYGGSTGAQGRYDFPLRTWLTVSPMIAVGRWSSPTNSNWVGAAGVVAGVGYKHRLTVDAVLAPSGLDKLTLHGTVVDSRIVYGPNVAVGYEGMYDGGAFQRFTVGYGFSWGPKAQGFDPSGITFALGFGVRTW